MVHTGIFATSAEITAKMGAGKSASVTEAMINAWCLEAESFINAITGKNWSDAYSGLNADKKYLLTMAETCYVAMYGISYDMVGYTTRMEAETMLSLNWALLEMALTELAKDQVKTFVESA